MSNLYLESYVWARGDYLVPQPIILQRCQATEGATTSTARVSTPTPFLTALKNYTDTFSAVLASTYTRSWDPTTNRITISSSGGTFDLTPDGNLRAALGLAATTTGATSYTGTSAPLGVVPLLSAEVEAAPPDLGAQVDLLDYRHGRASVLHYSNHTRYLVSCWTTGEAAQAMLSGYCTRGRVRLHLGDDANAQSPEHLDGYIDGYVFSAKVGETQGDSEEYVRVDLGIAVPEAT
ncbi:MAG: hypothetical protein H6747_09580 [Deltaproteobacteria bacterium]|nr:hypothetical protein [Deltaproteobacteria bacterium]